MEYDIRELDDTLAALEGKHGEGWINITMEERRLFAALLREKIWAFDHPGSSEKEADWRMAEVAGKHARDEQETVNRIKSELQDRLSNT